MAQPGDRPPATYGTSGGSSDAKPAEPDWAAQAADAVERVVGTIRDKTSVPLTTVARAVVFGLIAGVMALAALVLVSIALVRVIDVATGDGNVWIAHFGVGGIFTIAGVVLLRRATATTR